MDVAFTYPVPTNPLSSTMYTTIPAHPFPNAVMTTCSHSAKPRRNSKKWDWKSPSSPIAKSNPACSPISQNSGMVVSRTSKQILNNINKKAIQSRRITACTNACSIRTSRSSAKPEQIKSFPTSTPLYKPARKSTPQVTNS